MFLDDIDPEEIFLLESQSHDLANHYVKMFNDFLNSEDYAASVKFSVVASMGITLLNTAMEMSEDLFKDNVHDQLESLLEGKTPDSLKEHEDFLN